MAPTKWGVLVGLCAFTGCRADPDRMPALKARSARLGVSIDSRALDTHRSQAAANDNAAASIRLAWDAFGRARNAYFIAIERHLPEPSHVSQFGRVTLVEIDDAYVDLKPFFDRLETVANRSTFYEPGPASIADRRTESLARCLAERGRWRGTYGDVQGAIHDFRQAGRIARLFDHLRYERFARLIAEDAILNALSAAYDELGPLPWIGQCAIAAFEPSADPPVEEAIEAWIARVSDGLDRLDRGEPVTAVTPEAFDDSEAMRALSDSSQRRRLRAEAVALALDDVEIARANSPHRTSVEMRRRSEREPAWAHVVFRAFGRPPDEFGDDVAKGQARRQAATWIALGVEKSPAPIDPFVGGPMRWKRVGDRIVAYATGPDERDDGGDLDEHRSSARDVGFVAGPTSQTLTDRIGAAERMGDLLGRALTFGLSRVEPQVWTRKVGPARTSASARTGAPGSTPRIP